MGGVGEKGGGKGGIDGVLVVMWQSELNSLAGLFSCSRRCR